MLVGLSFQKLASVRTASSLTINHRLELFLHFVLLAKPEMSLIEGVWARETRVRHTAQSVEHTSQVRSRQRGVAETFVQLARVGYLAPRLKESAACLQSPAHLESQRCFQREDCVAR